MILVNFKRGGEGQMKQFIKVLRTRNSWANVQKILTVVDSCDPFVQEGIIKDVIIGDRMLYVMGDYIITRDLILENILIKQWGKRNMELIMKAIIELDAEDSVKHVISEGLKTGDVSIQWNKGIQFVLKGKKK